MPAYSTARSYMTSLVPGSSLQVWNAEQPAPGNGGASASQPVALAIGRVDGTQPLTVDGFFSADPGAFEVDVQSAQVDADAQYQTLPNGNITTRDGTNFTFHYEDPNANVRFVRLLMRSRTNAVNVTATIKR